MQLPEGEDADKDSTPSDDDNVDCMIEILTVGSLPPIGILLMGVNILQKCAMCFL